MTPLDRFFTTAAIAGLAAIGLMWAFERAIDRRLDRVAGGGS